MDREDEVRARLDDATQGPWSFDSYCRVIATRYAQREEEAEEGENLYEANATICHVPARSGDTATGRHAADARLIANAPADLRYLLGVIEDLRKRGGLDVGSPQ